MKLANLKFALILLLVCVAASSGALAMTIALGSPGTELIAPGHQWRFFRGTQAPSNPPDAWKNPGFDDSGWELGESGFGYGDGDDETVLSDMEDNYVTVYIRKEFSASSLPADQIVQLVIDYDDGFVAYLNGDKVADKHMPDDVTITYATTASSHEAGDPETIGLGTVGDLLNDGNNVLAIEGHNISKDSSDFSLIPALRTVANIARNGETWIVETSQVTLQGVTDAPQAVSVMAGGVAADLNPADGTWQAEVSLAPGRNIITAEALDSGANVVDSGSAEIVYVPAANHISGELTGDTMWSGACVLDSSVIVPDGNILTIEPGTVVLITENAGITVHGQLLANGTESEPIRFTHYGDGTMWERIMFIEAADSRLSHCIIEYSDCEGDHKDYYDNDCDPGTPLPSRTYFQAVVAIACHVDIEGCLFQKLPDDSSSPEGDAIAIISDDPDRPGDATANIRNCRFISIGQGVHTRYSYVLVEDCFFTDHHGDNDDVDLYGESVPVPMVRNNFFLDSYDDYINPTRCSAVFIGNVIIGGDRTDRGVVLRDRCTPIMINNLIYDCGNGGIALQNQCNALLINNTIVNCGVGIEFWDHTDRWGPPYCLYHGSGSATVVNCIIWDCSTSFDLDDSPYPEDRGSHATVLYCDVEGGQGSTSVSANSTLTWDPSNINSNPQFVDPGSLDFHLKSGAGRWDPDALAWVTDDVNSPCIDAGTSYLVDDPNYGYSGLINYVGELWPHGGKVNMGAYGATRQAAMSPDKETGRAADVDYSGTVEFTDFGRLAEKWMAEEPLLAEDIDRNGLVNFSDLLSMVQQWLWQEHN